MTISEDHSAHRIVLYYCYVPIPDVTQLIEFHEPWKKPEKPLGGRVRVASEGLNGVLSGLLVDLQSYEAQLRKELIQQMNGTNKNEFELDMKYCELRRDLPVAPQLFTELLVQKTSQVVSLVEMESYHKRVSAATRKNNRAVVAESEYRTLQEIYQKSLLEESSLAAAQHLSPAEWNETFEKVTRETTTKNGNPNNKVVLLDCRNSYESAVGYFCAPNASTILTNTRKFSELPLVLLQQVQNHDNHEEDDDDTNHSAATALSEADHIFMYCTGGVRCERASGFLKTLLQEKKKQTSSSSSLPRIYQLHGGIQRYLEHDDHYLYHGKNFVFDPRRTDPNHGDIDIVGRCLVCDTPHDDYDNGNAPAENREARCYKCRILILVCNTCRQHVTCWGESSSIEDTEDEKPKLYCGGKECLHMPPVRVIRP
jgi:predicted sulfurtransferase